MVSLQQTWPLLGSESPPVSFFLPWKVHINTQAEKDNGLFAAERKKDCMVSLQQSERQIVWSLCSRPGLWLILKAHLFPFSWLERLDIKWAGRRGKGGATSKGCIKQLFLSTELSLRERYPSLLEGKI
jgi:hypothetical protein